MGCVLPSPSVAVYVPLASLRADVVALAQGVPLLPCGEAARGLAFSQKSLGNSLVTA